MKEKLKQMLKNILHLNTIFTQLVLFTVSVSLVPIIFISLILFEKISNMVTEDLINSHRQLAAQYTSNLEDSLIQYGVSLEQIANNTIILNTLMGKTEDTNPYTNGNSVSVEVNKSLNRGRNNKIRNCMVYSIVDSSKVYGNNVAMMQGASWEIWYLNNKALDEDYFIYSSLDGRSIILSLIQNIVYIDVENFQRYYLGFIKLDIFMEQLFAPTTDTSEETYSYDVIALDKENNVVYSSNKAYNEVLQELSFEQLQRNDVSYYKDTMFTTDIEDNYGLKLVFAFNNIQLVHRKAELYRTILPLLMIVIGVIIVTAFVFTRRFSRRVAKLINRIKIAETGDLTITEEIHGNDEIAILDKQFNHMLLKLDDLIHKNYIQQLEKKETEFRNLQLQINPHFLYNTLETISSIAAVKQAFVICDLCEKLGENFRYSLGKNYGQYVSVTQELQHTQNYVYIQKTRFGNKFEVFYHIEPGLEDKLVLRFILQPIVENAIIHGLSMSPEKGTLEITMSKEKELLIIKIEDDGVGMSPEKVKEINRYIDISNDSQDERSQSIGIRNVNHRIKLACGNEYGIKAESTQYRGSCFVIYLPLMQ